MVKIDLLEPICNDCGTIYYAGFVNGIYTHFLGYDRLSKNEIKTKLLNKYSRENILEQKTLEKGL